MVGAGTARRGRLHGWLAVASAALTIVAGTALVLPSPPTPAIWPRPLAATFAPAELRLTHQAPLRWELVERDTQAVAGPVLSRALRRCETALRAASDLPTGPAAATPPTDRPVRWVLTLGSWNETLIDTVDESYSLTVTDAGVAVTAETVWGARHALDTLTQLARPEPQGGAWLRHAVVTDAPQYEYRGLMVSPGQRFMTPALLKTTLVI